ncbi:hypothetical protein B0T13DRAFT_531000 [Neurospora crassa]|nr:hypothetical protein B0T13DRAFT_531000 [Neurospora crassa]
MEVTKYTAEYMLAHVKDKTWLNSIDPNLETLKLHPIPELKADMSNFHQWERTLDFHLRYYGLHVLVYHMKDEYPAGPGCKHFDTADHWHRWQHHCLYAYSIIYSQAAKVIEEGDLLQEWVPTDHCPHNLFMAIREYKWL